MKKLDNKIKTNIKEIVFFLDILIILILAFSIMTNMQHSVIGGFIGIFSFEVLLEMPRIVYLIISITSGLIILINAIMSSICNKPINLKSDIFFSFNLLICLLGVIAIINCLLIYTTGYTILGIINSILW